MCVEAGLELNSAGLWPSRNWVWYPWDRPINLKLVVFNSRNQLFTVIRYLGCVTLQFPYELSLLSVFWITFKSNQKYMLDVVKKVFSRSGQTKTMQRGIMAFELTYSTENMSLYIYIYMGPEHSYYRKSKELPNKVNKITLPPHIAKEPCVFSEIKSITLHLCAVTIIYAEIKSNRLLPGKLNQYQQNASLQCRGNTLHLKWHLDVAYLHTV